MSAALQSRTPLMNAEAFLEWTLDQPGDRRWELLDGVPVAMAPQTFGHADTKYRIARACSAAIEAARLPCRVLVDGMGVRATARRVFIPDVMIQCGGPIDPQARLLDDPIAIVEVLSPSTRRIDVSVKFLGYFKRPSLCHYLIVDPAEREGVLHSRGRDGIIVSRVVTTEPVHLDPPGFDLAGLFDPT